MELNIILLAAGFVDTFEPYIIMAAVIAGTLMLLVCFMGSPEAESEVINEEKIILESNDLKISNINLDVDSNIESEIESDAA